MIDMPGNQPLGSGAWQVPFLIKNGKIVWGVDWVVGERGIWGMLGAAAVSECGAGGFNSQKEFLKEQNISFLCPLVLLGLTTSVDGLWGTVGGLAGREWGRAG